MTSIIAAVFISLSGAISFAAEPARSLKIVVSHDAPAEVKAAAASIAAAVKSDPLLRIFSEGKPVESVESENLLAADPADRAYAQPVVADGGLRELRHVADPTDRAYAHLVLVGLLSDPMIQRVWQHEAKPIDGGLYIFGFGSLVGDLGYIESDRNPFLHGIEIKSAPFETEIVTVTGTTPAGVTVAAAAFLQHDLINGVIAPGKWSRPEPGLLDRDPLTPAFTVPKDLPEQIGKAIRIGVTQASEDEYRGVLQDTGVEPAEIWRAKYFVAGAWDGKGAAAAMKDYHAGLHRRATGNTLWAARFESDEQAKLVAPKIADAAGLKPQPKAGPEHFAGRQPPFTSNDSPGSLTLWREGSWVIMSTLNP